MTITSVLSALGNILLTSFLTSLFMFLSLRWIFGKLINPITHVGAKLMATKSGEVRASKAVTEDAAESLLNSPNLAGIKMLARNIGFDIDTMVEEHGAVETLAGITQLLSIIGIKPEQFLSQGLGSLGENLLGKNAKQSSGNPYK